jgi:hypothetical protein
MPRADRANDRGEAGVIVCNVVPIVALLAAPAAFIAAVDKRIASTDYVVVQWWADDLDGDHRDDNIAAICNQDKGFYFIQSGDRLFEADMQINGRHHCFDVTPPASRPAWAVRHDGTVTTSLSGTKQDHASRLAIRDHQLVVVARQDVDWHDGVDTDIVDYDKLTWTSEHAEWTDARDAKRVTAASRGVLVLATPHNRRATPVGPTTLTATGAFGEALVLHVHAERAVVVQPCAPTAADPCTPIQIATGDRDVAIHDYAGVVVIDGSTRFAVHLEPIDGDAAYPPAPPSP